jgi:acyl carrier protein
METRESIIARIKDNLPFAEDPDSPIRDESVLADLGVNSLHLITMLLALKQEYSLDLESMARYRMPTTIGDLVTLVEGYRPED